MPESLLSPSGIKLFGRVFPGFDAAHLPAALGGNNFLRQQILAVGARFARIYAISYEGTFHHLSRPAVFLVHTDGAVIRGAGLSGRGLHEGGLTDDSGLIAKGFEFERSDETAPNAIGPEEAVRFWEYDKGDFTLRIDFASGTFEDVLLDAEVDTQLQISGAGRVQTSGAGRVQTSGAGRVQMSHAGRMQMAHRSRD